jgi:hypothetical protein
MFLLALAIHRLFRYVIAMVSRGSPGIIDGDLLPQCGQRNEKGGRTLSWSSTIRDGFVCTS